MSHKWNRREFLGAGVGLLGGGLALSAWPRMRPLSMGRPDARHLPPRVVGLRTLGGDFRFDPVGLLIQPGESVIWLNMGDFHTTTAFHPDNNKLLAGGVPLRIPAKAQPWHSGMLGLTAGTEFEHKFNVEGVHDYFCQPHYNFGMVGRIVVGGARGGPAVTRPLAELPEAAQRQIPSVEAVTGAAGRTFEWAARLNGLLYLTANGRDVGPAVESLTERLQRDEVLWAVVNRAGNREALGRAVAHLVKGIMSELDYEELVARADAAKRELEHAGRAAA